MIPEYEKTNDASVLVLEEADMEVEPRILELRRKIHDVEYLNDAVQRIAFIISKQLVENPEELTLREFE